MKAPAKEISPKWMAVTIRKAKQWLEATPPEKNREWKEKVINRYARDMATGNWTPCYDPIILDADGAVRNGQNRLRALIRAGVTIRFLVVMHADVEPDEMMNYDTGKKRSFADFLHLHGISDANRVAAATRCLWNYLEGGNPVRAAGGLDPTMSLLWTCYNDYPDLAKSIPPVRKLKNVIANGCATTLHYVFSKVDQFGGDEFIQSVIEGDGLNKGDPILALRDRIWSPAIKGQRLPLIEKAALTIKAWNAFYEGRTVKSLNWRRFGTSPERFPVVAGCTLRTRLNDDGADQVDEVEAEEEPAPTRRRKRATG